MATTLKLTWDKATKRWCKVFRGRKLYLGYGKSKSDLASYQLALEQFDIKRAEIDSDQEANKPHRAEYAEAIRLRQEMLKWLDLEQDHRDQFDLAPVVLALRTDSDRTGWLTWQQEHDRLVKEVERLNLDVSRVKPPKLGVPGSLPVDPIAYRPREQQDFWREKIDALRQYQKWTRAKDPANTLEANIDQFLKERAAQARAGEIAAKRYDCCRRHLDIFRKYIGPMPIEHFSGKQLTSFHTYLLEKITGGDYSKAYSKSILTDVKHFTTWLWEQSVIEQLPRNFKRLSIELDITTPRTIPLAIVKALLKGTTGRAKLYILLMLNAGLTQKDIADLLHSEVDWQSGRIVRKRSKTKKRETCPVVNYKLWPDTFRLLKQYRSSHPTLALVNDRGNPLRQLALKDGDKLRTNDSIRKALLVAYRDMKIEQLPPKLFRKTSSTLIYNAKQFRGLDGLFLGHAPDSVATTNYNAVGDTILDEAIDYLAKQYDIA